ncbi:MAG: hypothetical protein EWV61_12765 [Microcystis aeruginosa Ma_AC_P_19900807_S300]|nr:MAG: hypothetical protein EWV61_12765 [Microcystis aeruginosa Ma_AC_P_19900807_S300]
MGEKIDDKFNRNPCSFNDRFSHQNIGIYCNSIFPVHSYIIESVFKKVKAAWDAPYISFYCNRIWYHSCNQCAWCVPQKSIAGAVGATLGNAPYKISDRAEDSMFVDLILT